MSVELYVKSLSKSKRRWFEEMKFTPIFVSLENKRCLFFGQENTFILAPRKKVTSASNISLHRTKVAHTQSTRSTLHSPTMLVLLKGFDPSGSFKNKIISLLVLA